jgi:Undecaprenyl-phosphate glucose phosphotransferase
MAGTDVTAAQHRSIGAGLASSAVPSRLSIEMWGQLLHILDTVLVYVVGWTIQALYLGDEAPWAPYQLALVVAATLAANLFAVAGAYDPRALTVGRLRCLRLCGCWFAIWVGLVIIAAMFKATEDYSRVWFVAWGGAVPVALLVTRGLFWVAVQRWIDAGRLTLNIALYGESSISQEFIEGIARSANPLYRVAGVFDERKAGRRDDEGRLPGLAELEAMVRNDQVQIVIVTIPWTAEERLIEVLARLRSLPIDIEIAPSKLHLPFRRARYGTIGGLPVLNVFNRAITGWSRIAKDLEDFLLGSLLLGLLAPAMLLVALAVKLESPGPVFFRQSRYGYNNRLIGVYKFRSMHHAATDQNAEKLVTQGDPRVTRLGAWLRRTSLDELPQLINVVRGEMSLVGPRPHALRAKAADRLYEDVVAEYAARHRVKPGITGWAQVNGWRGVTDTEDKIRARVEHDIFYIENWSVLFDLKILLMTVVAVIKSENAH